LLGSDVVFGETNVRGYRTPSGFALSFDDTGRFDVSHDGTVITWHRPPGASVESAQADLTSRVLALALHVRGVFTLHASAVSIGGSGVAFVAPKHYGKSTLCSALMLAGARALSDDTVPVRPGNPPWLAPGLPSLRLWTDTATRLFGVEAGTGAGRKYLVNQFKEGQIESRPVPFRAAYVLNPMSSITGDEAAIREPLASVEATMMLVKHAKLGPVLTSSESPVMLSMAADIARVVPVYVLHVLRDLDRLDEVSQLLTSWHADEPDHHVAHA
jgi:hypothetical protein